MRRRKEEMSESEGNDLLLHRESPKLSGEKQRWKTEYIGLEGWKMRQTSTRIFQEEKNFEKLRQRERELFFFFFLAIPVRCFDQHAKCEQEPKSETVLRPERVTNACHTFQICVKTDSQSRKETLVKSVDST